MFQGSYRYRPVTELSLAKKPLRHPSDVTAPTFHSSSHSAKFPLQSGIVESIVTIKINYLDTSLFKPNFIYILRNSRVGLAVITSVPSIYINTGKNATIE
jgi:hypothetical protein